MEKENAELIKLILQYENIDERRKDFLFKSFVSRLGDWLDTLTPTKIYEYVTEALINEEYPKRDALKDFHRSLDKSISPDRIETFLDLLQSPEQPTLDKIISEGNSPMLFKKDKEEQLEEFLAFLKKNLSLSQFSYIEKMINQNKEAIITNYKLGEEIAHQRFDILKEKISLALQLYPIKIKESKNYFDFGQATKTQILEIYKNSLLFGIRKPRDFLGAQYRRKIITKYATEKLILPSLGIRLEDLPKIRRLYNILFKFKLVKALRYTGSGGALFEEAYEEKLPEYHFITKLDKDAIKEIAKQKTLENKLKTLKKYAPSTSTRQELMDVLNNPEKQKKLKKYGLARRAIKEVFETLTNPYGEHKWHLIDLTTKSVLKFSNKAKIVSKGLNGIVRNLYNNSNIDAITDFMKSDLFVDFIENNQMLKEELLAKFGSIEEYQKNLHKGQTNFCSQNFWSENPKLAKGFIREIVYEAGYKPKKEIKNMPRKQRANFLPLEEIFKTTTKEKFYQTTSRYGKRAYSVLNNVYGSNYKRAVKDAFPNIKFI